MSAISLPATCWAALQHPLLGGSGAETRVNLTGDTAPQAVRQEGNYFGCRFPSLSTLCSAPFVCRGCRIPSLSTPCSAPLVCSGCRFPSLRTPCKTNCVCSGCRFPTLRTPCIVPFVCGGCRMQSLTASALLANPLFFAVAAFRPFFPWASFPWVFILFSFIVHTLPFHSAHLSTF